MQWTNKILWAFNSLILSKNTNSDVFLRLLYQTGARIKHVHVPN